MPKHQRLGKVMKTVVAFGNAFGADKLVNLGGGPHTVLMLGSDAVAPVIDIFNECADASLKAYAEYTIDPQPYDLYNLETSPEQQYKLQNTYNLQTEMEMVHLRLGLKDMNYRSRACYWPEVGIPLHLFCSPLVSNHFLEEHAELVRDMKRAGITFTNTCPLTFCGIPGITATQFCVTNSNKAREYTNSRFFKDEDLLEIILTGAIPEGA